jgi:hypothetical protein
LDPIWNVASGSTMATAWVVTPMLPGMNRLSERDVAVTRTAFAWPYDAGATTVNAFVAASAIPTSTVRLCPAAESV